MKFPPLFRRREVPFPTIWGWLALLLTAAAAVTLAALNIQSFLAVNQLVGARLLVVEGWIGPAALDQAIDVFRAGHYERVATTGGSIDQWPTPVHGTYAELAADYLKQHGLAQAAITAVPSPSVARDRTYTSAVVIRDWAKRSGIAVESIDVISMGTHARRTRLLYRMAFGPDIAVGVHAAPASAYEGRKWWRSSNGARDVLDQGIGLLWVKCCFWPSPPES